MKLYDNDEYRDDFMSLVYSLLHSDGTNDRANQIIDAFDSIPEVEAELLPPNNPLTLDELRDMNGEPVWTKCLYDENRSGWTLVDSDGNTYNEQFSFYDYGYGDTWLAYRRRPED